MRKFVLFILFLMVLGVSTSFCQQKTNKFYPSVKFKIGAIYHPQSDSYKSAFANAGADAEAIDVISSEYSIGLDLPIWRNRLGIMAEIGTLLPRYFIKTNIYDDIYGMTNSLMLYYCLNQSGKYKFRVSAGFHQQRVNMQVPEAVALQFCSSQTPLGLNSCTVSQRQEAVKVGAEWIASTASSFSMSIGASYSYLFNPWSIIGEYNFSPSNFPAAERHLFSLNCSFYFNIR